MDVANFFTLKKRRTHAFLTHQRRVCPRIYFGSNSRRAYPVFWTSGAILASEAPRFDDSLAVLPIASDPQVSDLDGLLFRFGEQMTRTSCALRVSRTRVARLEYVANAGSHIRQLSPMCAGGVEQKKQATVIIDLTGESDDDENNEEDFEVSKTPTREEVRS